MKIKPAQLGRRAVNTAIVPLNVVITLVNMTIQFAPLVWVSTKFLTRLPKLALVTYRDIRRIGLYQFVDRKGRKFNILLTDSLVADAIHGANNSPPRQYVLDELKKLVATDMRCPDFEVPKDVYLWDHPVWGFKAIERLRDVTSSERKEHLHLIRDVVTGYVELIDVA